MCLAMGGRIEAIRMDPPADIGASIAQGISPGDDIASYANNVNILSDWTPGDGNSATAATGLNKDSDNAAAASLCFASHNDACVNQTNACSSQAEVLANQDKDRDLWRIAFVDFGGVGQWVSLACLPQARLGDYVLVHVGMAIAIQQEEIYGN